LTVQGRINAPLAQNGSQRIYSINETADATSANSITLTVVTGITTQNVWVHHSRERWTQGRLMQSSNTQRTWQVTFTPLQTTTQNVTVYANSGFFTHGAVNRVHRIALDDSTPPPTFQSANQGTNRVAFHDMQQYINPNTGTYLTNGLIAGLISEYLRELSHRYRNFPAGEITVTPQRRQRHERLLQDIINAWERDPGTRAFGINRAGIQALLNHTEPTIERLSHNPGQGDGYVVVRFASPTIYSQDCYYQDTPFECFHCSFFMTTTIRIPAYTAEQATINHFRSNHNRPYSFEEFYADVSYLQDNIWDSVVYEYLTGLFTMIGFSGRPLISCHYTFQIGQVDDFWGRSLASLMARHLLTEDMFRRRCPLRYRDFDIYPLIANAVGLHNLIAATRQGDEYFVDWMTTKMQYIFPNINFTFSELRLALSGLNFNGELDAWRYNPYFQTMGWLQPRYTGWETRYSWFHFVDAVVYELPISEQNLRTQTLNNTIAWYLNFAIDNHLPTVPITREIYLYR